MCRRITIRIRLQGSERAALTRSADVALEAERGFEGGWVQKQGKGVGGAQDENVRLQQGVKRTAFSVIDGNGQATRFGHRPQKEAIIVAVAERGDAFEIESPGKGPLFEVLPRVPEHVGDGDAPQLLSRGSVRIGRDDCEIGNPPQAPQKGLRARSQLSLIGQRAGVIAYDSANDASAKTGNINCNALGFHAGAS